VALARYSPRRIGAVVIARWLSSAEQGVLHLALTTMGRTLGALA